MNRKLLGIALGSSLTLAGLVTGCSDTNETASGTESALKGGKKAALADGGMAPCTKSKKPKHDGGSKDSDDDTDESDVDADADESTGDGGRGKGNGGKPDDAGQGKGGGKPDDVGGGKPDDVGPDADGGPGKSDEAKLNKDKGGKKCLEDDGTVGEEDETDEATHGKSGDHGKGLDNGKAKDGDAGA